MMLSMSEGLHGCGEGFMSSRSNILSFEPNRSVVNAVVLSAYVAIAATLYREFTGSELLFVLGSYHFSIYEPCIASSSFALVSLILSRKRTMNWGVVFSLGLFSAFAISVIRGLFASPADALFTGRIYFTFPVFLLIATVAPISPALVRRISSGLMFGGTVLAILVIVRSTFGILSTEVTIGDGRPILAYGATLMAIAAILCLSDSLRHPKKFANYIKILMFLTATIMARQGTAGIGTILGLMIVWIFERGPLASVRRVSLLLAPLLVLGIVIFSPNISNTVSRSSDLSTFISDRQNTNETREQIWESFSKEFDKASATDEFFGKPMGQKFEIYLNLWGGVEWDNALHSMYYQILSILGYLGLTCYALILANNLFGALFRVLPMPLNPEGRPVSQAATLACIVFVIVFGRSYDFRGDSAVLLLFGTLAMRALHQAQQRGNDENAKDVSLQSLS